LRNNTFIALLKMRAVLPLPVSAPLEAEEFGDLPEKIPRSFPEDLFAGTEDDIEGKSCWLAIDCVVVRGFSAASVGDSMPGAGSTLGIESVLFFGRAVGTGYE